MQDSLQLLKQNDVVLYDAFHIITELVNCTKVDIDMKLGLIITLFITNSDLQLKSANLIATDDTIISLYVDLIGFVSEYKAECLEIQNDIMEEELEAKKKELQSKIRAREFFESIDN